MAGSSSSFGSAFAAEQMASFPSSFPQRQQPQHQSPSAMSNAPPLQTQVPSGNQNVTVVNGTTSGLSFPSMDLSGKLIIKVRIEGDEDFRRIPIHNEDITYDELLLMMQRVFVGKINSSDDVVVKYRDEDGDFITIADNSDLTMAKQASRILHLKLYFQGRVFRRISGCSSCNVQDVRQELIKVRDHVNHLLDLIVPDDSATQEIKATAEAAYEVSQQESFRPMDTAGLSVAQKLFDPLKSQNAAAASSAGGTPPPAAAVPASAPHAATAPSHAAPVAEMGTVSAIADSFGLAAADDIGLPPEQPNAPPSDAMNSFAPTQQQEEQQQQQQQQQPQQQQQHQLPHHQSSQAMPQPQQPSYPYGAPQSNSTVSSAPPSSQYNSSGYVNASGASSSSSIYYSSAPPAVQTAAGGQPPSQPFSGYAQPQSGGYSYGAPPAQQPSPMPTPPVQQYSGALYAGKSVVPPRPGQAASAGNPYSRQQQAGSSGFGYPPQGYNQ